MKKYKMTIFDFDGTICKTEQAIVHCILKTFETFGEAKPKKEIVKETVSTGVGLKETFELLDPIYFDTKTNDIKQWIITYREIYKQESLDKISLFDGVEKIFENLHKDRTSIVVVSNKGKEAVETAIDKFGLSNYVSLIVADTGEMKKPDPKIYYEYILPKLGDTVKKSEVIIIGDTPSDLLFAIKVGVDSCWAAYGYGDKGKCNLLNPKYTIDSIAELNNILS